MVLEDISLVKRFKQASFDRNTLAQWHQLRARIRAGGSRGSFQSWRMVP